ncbi:nitroreductase family protein [Mycoplasmatota bacterium WC44]
MNEIFVRRSIRTFKNEKVSSDKIDRVLRAAMQAPSAKNQQPWYFVVIDDAETLADIRKIRGGSKPLFTAPVVIVLAFGPNLKAASRVQQDMGCATQNLMLEAVSLGLGTIWIGTYPDEETMDEVRKVTNMPSDYSPYAVIGVGYPLGDENKFLDRYNEERIRYNKW